MSAFVKKFRPRNKKQLIGESQNQELGKLLKSIEDGEPFQKILIIGPTGTGKTTISEIYIRALLGLTEDTDVYSHVRYFNCGGNRGIDVARNEIIGNMNYASLYGEEKKIFLLDEIHALTRDAQKSLLTPIENAPSHCYFICCSTDVSSMEQPLLDRFQRLYLQAPSKKEFLKKSGWIAKSVGKELSQEEFEKVYALSNGSVRVLDESLEGWSKGGQIGDVNTQEDINLVSTLLFNNLWSSGNTLMDYFNLLDKKTDYNALLHQLLNYAIYNIRRPTNDKTLNRCILAIDVFGDGLSLTVGNRESFHTLVTRYFMRARQQKIE